MEPFTFLRRCFDCNRNLRDHEGSSYRNRLWRCAACTQKEKRCA
jgi:hypothetical protein